MACVAACESAPTGPSSVDAGVSDGALADNGSDVISVTDVLDMTDSGTIADSGTGLFSGPYGTAVHDRAGDFTVATTDGPFTLSHYWTGEDSVIVLVYSPGTLRFQNGTDYTTALFDGRVLDLIDRSPRNVHYLLLYRSDPDGFASRRDEWLADLSTLPEADRTHWLARFHFATEPLSQLDNWVEQLLEARRTATNQYIRYGAVQFAIDRDQRIREVGQLGRLAQGGLRPDLSFLAYEPQYYNFEHDRAARLQMENATTVTVIDHATVHDTYDTDVALPEASELARFDSLQADLTLACPEGRDTNCGAWDYLSHLWVCTADDSAMADGGTVADGSTVADSGTVADGGAPRWRCDTELARWITTYWREGRWVTDISGVLPLLRGGRTHLRWWASGQFDPRSTDYIASLSLRFSNRGRGMRPVSTIPLWQGGNWNAMYNASHSPMHVEIPADARRVELYALITGHGGVAPTNCAEFCNHEHHFSVGGTDFVKSFPEAQSPDGCAGRVNEGVVPNQHGTWYFGRGGWCPGFDVSPWVVDVTAQAHPGTTVELRYATTFNGGRPVSASMGNIVLSSYLVVWR